MDLTTFSKAALLKKCDELGIVKCKSKNKKRLIELINKIIEKILLILKIQDILKKM